MKPAAIISLTVLALATGYVQAADPSTAGPAVKAAGDVGAPAPMDERQKLLDAGAKMMQGKYDEAIEAAKGLLKTAKEEATWTDAARVIAQSLRKKCDWRGAAAAYLKLRDRYEKGSDNHVKNEAIAEILMASPTGVYPPLEAAAKAAPPAEPASAAAPATEAAPAKPGANLADDDYLARAIACLADGRIEKFKGRAASIKRTRTPQEAQAAFASLVEDIRQTRCLASSSLGEPERAAAKAANDRLADLGKQVIANLNAKLNYFQTALRNFALPLAQLKDMEAYQIICTDLAKNETNFQAVIGKMTGLTSASQMRTESIQRADEYTKLAKAFESPLTGRGGGGRGGGRGGG